MTLKTMYALKTNTQINEVAPILPYQFSAVEKLEEEMKDAENVSSEGINFACIVDIVMPIGGSQSGFFRYPKFGEKVLVGIEDNNKYLMGYLHDDTDGKNNVYTGADNNQILPEEMAGQFFRYKGPKDSHYETIDEKEKFSEIGFYSEETKWKPKEAKDSDPYPKVTTMKIHSTGDINQKAANHNQIKARRFELLVNCEGSKKSDKDSTSDFAFSDQVGEDSELYAGDAHIRAKSRIILKAEDEIRLEVGRSLLIINDTGITIASRKTRSNIASGWDTTLGLSANDGLSMFGQRIIAKAGIGFNISEGYGGSIVSQLGVLRIDGLDIRLATVNTANYAKKVFLNGVDYLYNAGLLALGLGAGISQPGVGVDSIGGIGSFSQVGSTTLIRCIGQIFVEKLTDSNIGFFDIKDTAGTMVSLVGILDIVFTVITMVLEMLIPLKMRREIPATRDGIYKSIALIKYGYVMAASIALTKAYMKGAIFGDVFWLTGDSTIIADSSVNEIYTHKKVDNNSLLAGDGVSKSMKEIIKGGAKELGKMLKENVIKLAIGGVAGLAVGGGVATGLGFAFAETSRQNKEFEEELRSL